MSNVEGLAHLVEEGVIDAVHARLMSGKEATVYVVERAGFLGAAKVYRARDDRTFKKVASYVEGRNQTRNTRDRRAMDRKTTYGRGLLEEGWQDMEFRALRAAFDAGVRVPEPFFLYENVLFMELVVDERGAPAGRLADFPFTPEEATNLHRELFLQVTKLLATGQIHGDLSAYNVLMSAAGPTIIDLPQVVDVSRNNNARQILRRDLRNVTLHLARFDARLMRFADCGEPLFQHFMRGTLDTITGPQESASGGGGGGGAGANSSRGGGRRGRDAERGRAGRDKGQRAPAPVPPPLPAVGAAGAGAQRVQPRFQPARRPQAAGVPPRLQPTQTPPRSAPAGQPQRQRPSHPAQTSPRQPPSGEPQRQRPPQPASPRQQPSSNPHGRGRRP